jgi:hydroxymethylbilane synthase
LADTLRIATRGSQLALWQAEHVASLLRTAHPALGVQLVPIVTHGDRVQDRALAQVGGKGLFVKELENALVDGRADIAVHSMKDVPSELPPGLAIAASLERANPLDAFLSLRHRCLRDLPTGARVGTSSPRRQSQLRAAARDLEIELLRGNVDTRLRRLQEGRFDAILLACAGLERLGLERHITEVLDPDVCVPAVGQGVIGIECRDDDAATRARLTPLHHEPTYARLTAERAFARALHGSCHSPIAAHATLDGARLRLTGFVGSPDGGEVYRDAITGDVGDADAIGLDLAQRIADAGAGALLERLRREAQDTP